MAGPGGRVGRFEGCEKAHLPQVLALPVVEVTGVVGEPAEMGTGEKNDEDDDDHDDSDKEDDNYDYEVTPVHAPVSVRLPVISDGLTEEDVLNRNCREGRA